jgi:hypothetical protein
MRELDILEARFNLRLHVTKEGAISRAIPTSDADEFGMMQRLREHLILNTTLEPAMHEGRAVPVIYEFELSVATEDF